MGWGIVVILIGVIAFVGLIFVPGTNLLVLIQLFPWLLQLIPLFIGIVIGYCVLWFLLPDSSRILYNIGKRSNKDKAVFVNCSDSGMAKIQMGGTHPLGFAEIKDKIWQIFVFLPRRKSGNTADIPPQAPTRCLVCGADKPGDLIENKEKGLVVCRQCGDITAIVEAPKRQDLEQYEDEITKRFFLEDVKRPLYLMYSAMAQTLNPATLASIDVDPADLPKRPTGKHYFSMLLDVRKMKEVLPRNFTMDQVNGLVQLCIEYGKRLAGKSGILAWLVIAGLAAGFAFMLGVVMGPQIGL